MDEIKLMICNTALQHMLSQRYFSICEIDKILKITCGIPRREDYDMLSALHCVDYSEMPAELLRGLPLLIGRVVGAEELKFDFEAFGPKLKTLEG